MQIVLTKLEEIALFMIINKISLKRSSIFLENISEKNIKALFKKFDIKSEKKKELVEKATAMGYSIIIPEKMIKIIDKNLGLIPKFINKRLNI